jgi:hypothetical protein
VNFNKSILFLFAACLFPSMGCEHAFWVQKDFDSLRTSIDTVSIIFPQIEYLVKYGNTAKTKRGYSLFVSNNVADVVKEIIDKGTFGPHAAVVVKDSLVIDQWIRNYDTDSLEIFRSIWDSVRTSHSGGKIFPLTPRVKDMFDEVSTRYIIYVTGIAYGTSNDKKFFDMIQSETFQLFYDRPDAYDYQWNGLQLHIFVVDKRSDEVLWYNYNGENDSKYDPLNKSQIYALCSKLMDQ